jgi:hypothetical protein
VQIAHAWLRYKSLAVLQFPDINQKRACLLAMASVSGLAIPGVVHPRCYLAQDLCAFTADAPMSQRSRLRDFTATQGCKSAMSRRTFLHGRRWLAPLSHLPPPWKICLAWARAPLGHGWAYNAVSGLLKRPVSGLLIARRLFLLVCKHSCKQQC